jgi:hypothetical protein
MPLKHYGIIVEPTPKCYINKIFLDRAMDRIQLNTHIENKQLA